MINFKSIFSASAAIVLATTALTTSCEDPQFEGCVKGVAIAKIDTQTIASNVKRGDKLTLVIAQYRDANGNLYKMDVRTVTISGISYPPEVHYLIDDVEVGKSSDFSDQNNCFKLEYVVKDLKPGPHTLTAKVPKQYENITYTSDIIGTKFNVVER